MKEDKVLSQLKGIDMTMHNPARLMIVYLLTRYKSLDYLDLMQKTELTSGNITTHLNKLADCAYISIHKSFIGKKPNTAVMLTEKGRMAYKNWGEMIISALPQRSHPVQHQAQIYPFNGMQRKFHPPLRRYNEEKYVLLTMQDYCHPSIDLPPMMAPISCIAIH